MEQVETKVDVLAVMDAACCVLAIDKCADPQKQLEQARAAIAELIEAAEWMSAYFHAESGVDRVIRLRNALFRVGGGLQGFVSQDMADVRCEQLQASSDATGTGREFRVLSWLPTLTPAQLAEGDLTAELR